MCGICGIINYKENVDNYINDIKIMNNLLKKRGPDQEGLFACKNALLGHRRLSVVDLENGLQPMTYDGYTIVFNGEIYNYEYLREELISYGYTFDTKSDTEVLLKLYHCFKEECLDKLNGIFAFCVFSKDESFIARDHAGVKPLFYKLHNDGIIFASEIKSILAHSEVDAVIDREGLSELLSLLPSRKPGSAVFKDIKSLRPGHYIKIYKDNIEIVKYFNLTSKKHLKSFKETKDDIRAILEDSITMQLNCDVNKACLLSGGIDSSIICAIASKNIDNLTTYSIDYEDNSLYFKSDNYTVSRDDYFIDLMIKEYNLDHHKEEISLEKLINLLEDATIARDLPGMADIDSSLLWFSSKIKENHTVALSGEVADEIFFGYPWYYREELLKLENFPWLTNIDDRQNLLNKSLNINIKDCINEAYDEIINEVTYDENDTELDKFYRRLMYINLTYFMPTLLDRKDRMTMNSGLEVRVPFADIRLIKYLWNVPFEYKHNNNIEKGLLREAFKDVLPHEIYERKKTPYPKTFNPKYTEIICEKLTECIKDDTSILNIIFDKEKINELIETKAENITTPWFGQLMKGPQLLAYLYQMHFWAKHYDVKLEI